MRSLGENQFHLLMATLLIGSLFLDDQARRLLPTWNAPKVSVITLALGLVWVALLAAYRLRALHDEIKVLRDRIERLTNRTDAMELSERSRRLRP